MRSRLKLVVGLLAAMALAAGVTWIVAEQMMRSPAEVAAEAEPPEAGPVTAPVEKQALTSEVITRGIVEYDEPTELTWRGQPQLADAGEPEPVVTRVPEAGTTLEEGNVAVEVSGRPLLVLQGELPTYRHLRPGMTGDDVAQLQEGLQRLGYDVGGADGLFGHATQQAVEAWYTDAGYDPAAPPMDREQRLEQAEDRYDEALDRLERARKENAGVSEAESALAEARSELGEARFEAGAWVPSSELAFIADLPSRVESVEVKLGDEATEELLTVTEGEVVVEADVDAEEAELISEGEEVDIVPDGDGGTLTGTVVDIADADEGDGAVLVVEPDDNDAAQELVDTSPRLDVPIESTEGEVLAVPVAALATAADGDTRVEVLRGDASGDRQGDGGGPVTEFVTVRPGLTAEGLAEVEPVDGELAEGDQVVVGTGAAEGSNGVGER